MRVLRQLVDNPIARREFRTDFLKLEVQLLAAISVSQSQMDMLISNENIY